MSNYRITIEPTTEEAAKDFPEELRKELLFDGFALICANESENIVAIRGVTIMDLGDAISKSVTFRGASRIAEGILEARKIERSENVNSLLDKLLVNGNCTEG